MPQPQRTPKPYVLTPRQLTTIALGVIDQYAPDDEIVVPFNVAVTLGIKWALTPRADGIPANASNTEIIATASELAGIALHKLFLSGEIPMSVDELR